ncbi:MAG TPA: TrkA C-terminal domain-containing protein, partial [Anaerolineae bacterium]|nr:TrkA C-terminal domain-containing protein [Anaerolineae bacterium]
CRTGQPIEMADLAIVSLATSKSIIILSPDGDDPDSHVIKTLLAITNHPQRRAEPYHIVAEIRNPDNLEVAQMVGRTEVELVLVGDLIARVTAQTCRQSGLSVVYTELLDFGGDEIYFKEEPTLVGKTFAEVLLAYDDSAVIGLHPAKRGGTPQLNPPMDTRLNAGDRLIVIAEDDDTIKLSGLSDYQIKAAAIQTQPIVPAAPERTLILGWNWRAPAIIRELDNYVAPGSTLVVVADEAFGPREADRAQADLKHQVVTYQAGSTTDRRLLESLNIEQYQHVILLCYAGLDPQVADARTLITLLHLREIGERSGHAFSIVSEMLDIRNRNLAEVTRADDFIVSDKLVSLMLAQISENKLLGPVFTDIFDPDGSEIYIKPAANYVKLGEPINFYTVIDAARRRGEVAFGYRRMADASDAAKSYGIAVNPDKSEFVTFTERDRIIVLAED